MAEKEIKKFIEEHVNKIKPISKNARLAYWNATLTGKKEHYDEYEKLQLEIEKIYNNKQEFEKIKNWYNQVIDDELVRRQIKILYNSYLSSQGDLELIKEILKKSTAIENKFNIFRAKIKNKEYTDNQIKDILKKEIKPEKLREAWEASKKQGALVEKELIELVKLRNKYAGGLGFKNYYMMSLELNEQKQEDVVSVFEELENLTNSAFKQLKKEIDSFLAEKYKIKPEDLKPWHYQDLFFQEGPEIYKLDIDSFYSEDILEKAKNFYKNINLEVEDILVRSNLYEKLGKYQHAYCINIDREGDIRTMQNLKNNEKWMDTLLHELGHAVYEKHIDKSLPYLLRNPAHIFTTEAIAMLFGRQSKNLSFIKNYCKTDNKFLDKFSKEIEKALRLRQLVFSRWAQVMMNFEKSLYENPNQNLNNLWWSLVKKYQLIDFSRDEPDWASKIHFVSAPVYYHNYLLGEILASQINNYIAKNILKTNSVKNLDYKNKEIGDYLKKSVFEPGEKYKWDKFIKRATGENLTSKYFVKEFIET